MKPTMLFNHSNRNQGFYNLTVVETEKSIIITEYTNHSGKYNKEIRYRKTKEIMEDIKYLIKTKDVSWFAYQYTQQRNNNSYWQKWTQVF